MLKHKDGDAVFEANLDDFEALVIEASEKSPVLVDFWADWCAPCHGLTPHLSMAMDELDGRVRLAKVEVDEGENMKLAGRYKLRGFPTVILFIQGEEKARFAGIKAKHWICEWVLEHIEKQI